YQFLDLHDILNGKMKDLQERRFGEKEGSMALTAQQVKEILSDEFLDPKTPQGLLYRFFFHNAIIFACRDGEHYSLQSNQFQIQPNGSILFYRYRNKNNQRGIQGGNAHCIQLPSDLSDIPGPVSNFTKYISKHPLGASDNFYLQPNPNWHDTNIWYLKTHCGLNRVGNFMRDIGQKVKNADIPEDAIMNITGHRSSQELHAYKTVNESQKVNTMKTLINTIKLASNTNIISQESPTVLTKITGSQINFNTNTVTMQDINIVQGQIHSEFQNQRSIFNNCHFTNIIFYMSQ
ncbi:26986_t:CDS:2, partial [Racocetra persica]